MIDNVDQDEWFNLYLYLGSKLSLDTSPDTSSTQVSKQILTRVLTQYSIPDTESGPKQGVSTRKSSRNTKSLTEERSVHGRSLHHLPDQPGPRPESVCCVRVHWDGRTQIFQSIFQFR